MQTSPTPAFAILSGADTLPAGLARPVLAIGNFDGVHRGHQAVIAAARRMAEEAGVATLAMTFEPHPRTFFNPANAPFRLTPEPEKLRWLATTGIQGAIVLTFDAALAGMEAEAFVRDILVGRYNISGATVGFDFHFGRARAGSPAFLKHAGARYGFKVEIVEATLDEGDPISSTAVRDALANGQVGHAAHMLGRPFSIRAEVIHGDARGRTLGFPTANLALASGVHIQHGIYAVRAATRAGVFGGVANYGRRPTFDNGPPLLEVHLFDFSGDLYGEVIEVEFLAYLRPEMKFPHVDALITQMNEDARRAREALSRP